MDNQHRKIKGYRELSEDEIMKMNAIKQKGIELGAMLDGMMADKGLDQRWVAIGKTDLQKGLMALTRSIARPDFF